MDRRGFLTRSLALGCSAAASPLLTPVSFAAAPGEARLVVIILRGAMDGLDVVAPHGDPDFAGLRGGVSLGGAGGHVDLDGFHALHPALSPLLPLWQAGDLGAVHAVSTPYRDKRSHFDGQDILEAGVVGLDDGAVREGWLNRMMQHMPDGRMQTAWAVGRDPQLILDGPVPVSRWAPEADLALSPQAALLARQVMKTDPAMAAALDEAFRVADADGDPLMLTPGEGDGMAAMAAGGGGPGPARRIADFVAEQLRGEARIAAFSLNGWDTHAAQARGLPRALSALSNTILGLREGLGPTWGQTAVLAMTEFGRTARMNGSDGTDHGTGGAMLFAGGALRGGRVLGEWPGLSEAALYDRRDLMPTRDLRAHAGWVIGGLFGLGRSEIEQAVFPGLDLGSDPGLLA
ncbi:DUF1501 domain-containing protein [Thetidibacter halocola]|uniref:DUF1501 domain-containing protein n=1 Tax=Thetidibacter halocola TaxID=2827239 RepID=A0A8J7WAD1_9RHOB|nr:DUF1501 domain-containing protein [Thetidibacter halocola]MBS0123875.1 DUF1501 domain-containing protein [Thetidibacter halocola]